MRLFVLTFTFAAFAFNSYAEVPVRKIAELEPIVPAIQQPKPDFEAGGFRVDMPAEKIKEHLIANRYTNTLRLMGKSTASVDFKPLATDEYDSQLNLFKVSDDKSKKEIIVLKLLPGRGGLYSINQQVVFQYQVGQTHRTRREVETAIIAKYGRPPTMVEKPAKTGVEPSNAHILGLSCFETEAAAMTSLDTCDVQRAHTNGYSYDIEVDERGNVVSYEVEYDASDYEKSYMEALYDKMYSIIRND